jgi:hypothetical protein
MEYKRVDQSVPGCQCDGLVISISHGKRSVCTSTYNVANRKIAVERIAEFGRLAIRPIPGFQVFHSLPHFVVCDTIFRHILRFEFLSWCRINRPKLFGNSANKVGMLDWRSSGIPMKVECSNGGAKRSDTFGFYSRLQLSYGTR